MDIHGMVQAAIQKAMEAEGQRLLERAKQMRPILVGDLSCDAPLYTSFVEFGQPPNTVDSTAIVIDENVKALPYPTSKEAK